MLSPQALAAPGSATGGLALYGHKGERITTLFFDFLVVRDFINLDDIKSSTDFDALRRAVALLESAIRLYEEFPRLNVLGGLILKRICFRHSLMAASLAAAFLLAATKRRVIFIGVSLQAPGRVQTHGVAALGPRAPLARLGCQTRVADGTHLLKTIRAATR